MLTIPTGAHPAIEWEVLANQNGDVLSDFAINGAIDVLGDHDTFRTFFDNPGNVTFRTQSTLDLEMGFWNDDVSSFRLAYSDDAIGTQPQINAQVSEDDPLAIVIGEFGDNAIGSYSLIVDGPSATPHVLSFLGSVSAVRPSSGGSLEYLRIYNLAGAGQGMFDHEFLQIVPPATGRYRIGVRPLGTEATLDPTIILFDSTGRPIVGNQISPVNDTAVGGAETRDIDLTAGQPYYLRVDGFGATEGFFEAVAMGPSGDQVGVFRNGTWFLDTNNNRASDPGDLAFQYGQAGDLPVYGDWNNDGFDEVGVFRSGIFYLDTNGNRRSDAGDAVFGFGQAGDRPVAGDWNNDGFDDVAVFRNGSFIQDSNGNRAMDGGDQTLAIAQAGDVPMAGRWNNADHVGYIQSSFSSWAWTMNTGGWVNIPGSGSVSPTRSYANPADGPVIGDWNNDGVDNFGAFDDGVWTLDADSSFSVDFEGLFTFTYGSPGDLPVAGRWNTAPRGFGVVAPDAGGGPHVRVFDNLSGLERLSFFAYDAGFTGGVRVATGDVNNDGTPDIITAPGRGGGPHVKVFNGINGAPLGGPVGSFFAYHPGFTGGVFVASGDVNGDGHDDIVTGVDSGGGPHVKVFSGATGGLLREFFAYSGDFLGGVRVAAADVNADGFDDVIVAPGPGGGPHVRIFSGFDGAEFANFFAYSPSFTGGVYVASGDLNGDGQADIITGAGAGGGPHVRALSGATGAELASFLAYSPTFVGGVRVGAGDINGDGRAELLTAPGPGGGPHVRAIDGLSHGELESFFAFDAGFSGGVFVAGGGLGGSPLRVAGGAVVANNQAPRLADDQLAVVLEHARNLWITNDASHASRLQAVEVRITSLSGDLLGLSTSTGIFIDLDAAGHGWFVDATPEDDVEFETAHSDASMASRVDLLTVLAHELGHILGLDDLDVGTHPHDVMSGLLAPGVRHLPLVNAVDAVYGAD